MSGNISNYRTHQVWIKKGHRLFSYLEDVCHNAKSLYNSTNFYIRQVYTAFTQDKVLQPLQIEVLHTLDQTITKMNDVQIKAYLKKQEKEHQKPEDQQKAVKCNTFTLPSKDQPLLTYRFLDCLFKVIAQENYRSLPTQCSQGVMRLVFQNWKSFFASLKKYRKNPRKFTGKPRIPKYIKTSTRDVVFSNQDCVIKDQKYLKFPLTNLQLNIGKLGYSKGKLKQVRVIPKYGQFVVEIVREMTTEESAVNPDRYMAIDLGLNNLATIVTNTGMKPVLFKGRHAKSINQYYNKLKSYYTRMLRQGKDAKVGPFTSRRLEKIHQTRFLKLKDIFHKVSYHIVRIAISEKLGTIIIGKNEGWKKGIKMSVKVDTLETSTSNEVKWGVFMQCWTE